MKKTFLSFLMGMMLLSGISVTSFDHIGWEAPQQTNSMTSDDHIGWGG
ncbi:hypothetical protein [Paenibacillus tyrfis]|nr:hypothetical protein [Paenibacillus tyrfis]